MNPLLFSPDDPLARKARCLYCRSRLFTASEPRCPGCGIPFDASDAETYRLDPGWADWRSWVPGVALALALGAVFVWLGAASGSFGFGFTVATPVTLGALLGYFVRVRAVVQVLVVLFVLLALAGFALAVDIAGVLCALIGAGVLLLPLLGGVMLGLALGRALRHRSARTRALTLVLLATAPAGLIYLESQIAFTFPEESVQTVRVVQASPERLWASLLFYEDVRQRPPLIARIGIPRPLRTEGVVRGVGDVKTCVYESGHLVKQITRYEPERLLAFRVVEQVGIEDRSIALTRGSFRFQPLQPGVTKVTLTTRYLPKLSARPSWRPWEQAVVWALHSHVLDEMERRARLPVEALP